MLVRYKGQAKKPGGMPVRIPVGADSYAAQKRTVFLNPTGDIPGDDAMKLVRLDSDNFELVEADVHEGLVTESPATSQGTEIVMAQPAEPEVWADPAPQKKSRRGKKAS